MSHKETPEIALLQLAVRCGPMGFSLSDVTGYPPKMARKWADRLCELAKLHKHRHGHRTVRYYATPEWANAGAPIVTTRARPASVTFGQARSVAPWKGKDIPMIIPKGLKVQKGPSFDPDRWRREDVRVSTNTHGQ